MSIDHGSEERWPRSLLIVRHGQSSGNLAAEDAEKSGLDTIAISDRDVDVPLSSLGERQAHALGAWLTQLPTGERPEVILASPFVRARQTALIAKSALGNGGEKIPIIFDERLREREFGIVDRLTKKGILQRFPLEAELRARLGKFYYRPPGGESWCDVILRLRSFIDSVSREYASKRVMVTCHTVVILCLRYLLEHLTEDQILQIDRENLMANCGVTSYRYDPKLNLTGGLRLESFNVAAPVEEAGEKITTTED